MPALMSQVKLPAHTDALFVMRTAAGYRHAFVAPAGLRFSRLCAYSNAGETQVGQEIDKTLQYLTMARLWGVEGRKRVLHIVVIDAQPPPIALAVPNDGLRTAELTVMHPRQLAPERVRRTARRARTRHGLCSTAQPATSTEPAAPRV